MLLQQCHVILQGPVPLPGEAQAFVAGRGERRDSLAHLLIRHQPGVELAEEG